MKIFPQSTKYLFGLFNQEDADNERRADQDGEVQIKDGVVIGSELSALPFEELPADECGQKEPETQPEEELASDEALAGDDNIKPERPGRLPRIEHYFTALKSANRSPRTIREYRFENKWWERQASARGLSVYNLRVADIEASVADLHPATARRKICFLRGLSRFYLRRGGFKKLSDEMAKLGTVSLPARLPKDRGPEAFIQLREQAKAWCRNGDRVGVWVGAMTMSGLRISEIASIEMAGTGNIRVLGKGNKERLVPAPSWLISALEAIPREGKKIGWARRRFTIWKALKEQGIKRPHSLRHTYASELLRRGRRVEEIQQLLGHSAITSTMIYARLGSVPNVIWTLEDEREDAA